jgi:putative endopeptidase
VSWTKVEQRDLDKTYNPKSRAGLKSLTPAFAWDAFLKGVDLSAVTRVIASEESALPKIAANRPRRWTGSPAISEFS